MLDIAVNRALADFAGFRLPDRRSDVSDATVWQPPALNLRILRPSCQTRTVGRADAILLTPRT